MQNAQNANTKKHTPGRSRQELLTNLLQNSSNARNANTLGGIIINLPIKDSKLKIIAKPNSPKTEITEVDKDSIKLNVKAQPEKGKANKEIIKFFSKLLKKQVTIKTGKTTKTKILSIQEK